MLILTLVAMLSVLLGGEGFLTANSPAVAEPLASRSVETTISDADIPNPSSLMSGDDSARSITSSRRTMQRSGGKRAYTTHITTREVTATAIVEHLHNTIKPNILGGVVADEAFYSLCCLRI